MKLVGPASWRLLLPFQSEAAPGARAFLTCIPSSRTRMEPLVFTTQLRVRLGVPEARGDVWCPNAMLCSTLMAITLGCAQLVGSALCATMACGTWFTAGLKRAAFALKKNDLASCCSSSLMKCTMPPDDLLMCFSLRSMVVRPPLTSPSRRLSGWTSLERRGSLWLRRRTLSTSEGILDTAEACAAQ